MYKIWVNLIWLCLILPQSGCRQESLELTYFYSAEEAYQKIEVKDNKIKYTFLGPGKLSGQSIVQAAHWTPQDLVRKAEFFSEFDLKLIV
mgnify:FL=1